MNARHFSDWERVVQLVGDDGAAALSAAYAGSRIYVPRFLGAHHPITQCVGPQAAAQLVAAFGTKTIDVPISLGRRAMIVQLLSAGESIPNICRRVGASRRTVFYVKAAERGADDDSDQLGLFSTD
ncbi:helix-turn-helix domain-containing protein [Brevundimonas vitis]|uniref:Helix-turn-helix domain-containing protein n=1 Tax=Brevundimonas vitisensis TaxID=2800818 RepID=A0ABX7BSH2_9CAUL|nr:helix-turn-helix domain-containing protein [Brevundimonas vitisensis]QQQ19693.1 helix-turn-helix domain-containing protein [Brevundimonas vitisensis]